MEYQHQLQHPVTPLGPPPPPQPVQHTPLPSLTSIQHAHLQDDDRWSQYHIWRQHVFVNGKSVNSKDVLEDKKDDNELWEAQAAFLGPNLWDKTLPYDPDLKVQEYVDLDEFLSENGMPGEALGGTHLGGSAFGPGAGLALGLQPPVTKRERSPSPSDCMSPDTINPPLSPADSTDDQEEVLDIVDSARAMLTLPTLRTPPVTFVPDDLKDDKYWARRRKNNMAAKRSRDARRMKENQIALRAGYLEKEKWSY
ncbi:unnamed protein product [Leptidea sinapis]|uniref:BZIP domain-containing protein n=2 Tax=Leptidea sinapis TaxID=189913 RepID=A0A5E4PLW2_9NEOP|nr:unnamed protein product [Leptidea sinapis]